MRIKLHALQYLRAIAAIAVVYSHTVLQVESYESVLSHFGDFGVDIFFVISGFIMVYIAKPGDTPINFMINRIRRVVPLYWFFLLLMAAILLFAPGLFKSSTFDLVNLLKSLFFVPYFSEAYPGQVWPLVAPGWSLNYEMYFYLVFAMSLLVGEKLRFWFITGVITVIYLIGAAGSQENALNVFYGNAIVFEFVLGMILAIAFKSGFRLSSPVGYGLIVVGLAILMLDLPINRIFSFGLPSLLVVAGTLFIKIPDNRFGVLLGDSSYALYLSHIFTLGVCRKVFPPFLGEGLGSALIFTVLSLIVCIVAGIVVHYVVDNWLLREERLANLKGLSGKTTAL